MTSQNTVTCSWCDHHPDRASGTPAGHVVLFACTHEHFEARPVCVRCARRAERYADDRTPFTCTECTAAAGGRRTPMVIAMVSTRAVWMSALDAGVVRFARPADRNHAWTVPA